MALLTLSRICTLLLQVTIAFAGPARRQFFPIQGGRLAEIEDPRRAEGKRYRLPHVVLFAILAMLAGANSYRSIHNFIDVHFNRLRKFFALKWRHTPAYATIRNIIRQLDANSVEQVFRRHAAILHERSTPEGQRHIAVDAKSVRLSFDNFCDRKAAHILSAFASDAALVLAHLDCDEKSRTKNGRGQTVSQKDRRHQEAR